MSEPTQFELFSSMRYDVSLTSPACPPEHLDRGSPYYMLPYHRDRMLAAARHFGWQQAIKSLQGSGGLARLKSYLDEYMQRMDGNEPAQAMRIRMVVRQDGVVAADTSTTPPVDLQYLFPKDLSAPGVREPWQVSLDKQSTPSTAFLTHKTTYRDMYSSARERAGIKSLQDPAEVLLYNPDGEIQEGSMTTPYFFRNGRWVTPPLSSGGNNATTRRWALKQGLCCEEVVTRSSFQDGERCWISNGVRGFIPGVLRSQGACTD